MPSAIQCASHSTTCKEEYGLSRNRKQ